MLLSLKQNLFLGGRGCVLGLRCSRFGIFDGSFCCFFKTKEFLLLNENMWVTLVFLVKTFVFFYFHKFFFIFFVVISLQHVLFSKSNRREVFSNPFSSSPFNLLFDSFCRRKKSTQSPSVCISAFHGEETLGFFALFWGFHFKTLFLDARAVFISIFCFLITFIFI